MTTMTNEYVNGNEAEYAEKGKFEIENINENNIWVLEINWRNDHGGNAHNVILLYVTIYYSDYIKLWRWREIYEKYEKKNDDMKLMKWKMTENIISMKTWYWDDDMWRGRVIWNWYYGRNYEG